MKKIIINPFEKYAATTLLAVGLAAMLLGWAAGFYFNARFDGAIDLHFVEAVGVYDPLVDLVISIGITTLMLFGLGKYINRKTRLIDVLNASLMAKIPFYFLTVFNYNGHIFKTTEKLMTGVQENVLNAPDFSALLPILVFSLIALAALVLAIVLWYNGFRVATNAKGNKSVFLFVAALLVAEILSKVFISFIVSI